MNLSADKLLIFQWSQAQVQFFLNAYEISRVHEKHFDFELTSDARLQPAFTCREGNRFWLFSLSRVDHVLRPIFMFWLVNISTGELMRKIYAASGNLLIDSGSWQSFVSSCDVLNCLFLLDVQNEIQLLSRLFCNSWLGCLLRFLLTNAPLVKVIGNRDFGWHRFQKWAYSLPLAWGVRGLKSLKRFWNTWWPSEAASRLVSLSNYCL